MQALFDALPDGISSIWALAPQIEKAAETRKLFASIKADQWESAQFSLRDNNNLKDRPGREQTPILVARSQVKKRAITQENKGRFSLLHALAHIELNAVPFASVAATHQTERKIFFPARLHNSGYRSLMMKPSTFYCSMID